ncbi:hypothetical protein APLC1_2796 [Limnospira platensis C1]|nr:hypothetical protein APLC1_2796 [Arthrospira platensis C1]
MIDIVEAHPDLTLWQYSDKLRDKLGINVSTTMIDRFLKQHDISLKKKTYRSEKVVTEEVQKARVDYW